MDILHISIANLRRKPTRTAAIALGLCALTAMLVALSLVHFSVNNAIDIGGDRLGADAMVVPDGSRDETVVVLLSGGPTEFYMDAAFEEQIRGVEGVESTTSQLFVISAPLSCCTVSDTMLVGINPESDFTISPWLRDSLEKEMSDDEIIVGTNILAEPGGRMKFYGSEFLIVGKLEPTGMKYIDSSVFVPMQGVREMISASGEKALKTLDVGSDEVSAVMVRLKQGASPEGTVLRIEHALPDVQVLLSSEVLRSARKNLEVPFKAMAVAVGIQWAVSLFLIGVLYSISISEREKEIGVLRATGARSYDVIKMFMYEVLIVSGLAGLAGIMLGLTFVVSFQNLLRAAFNVPFLLPEPASMAAISFIALLLALATSAVASVRPIRRIAGSPPYDAMRIGG